MEEKYQIDLDVNGETSICDLELKSKKKLSKSLLITDIVSQFIDKMSNFDVEIPKDDKEYLLNPNNWEVSFDGINYNYEYKYEITIIVNGVLQSVEIEEAYEDTFDSRYGHSQRDTGKYNVSVDEGDIAWSAIPDCKVFSANFNNKDIKVEFEISNYVYFNTDELENKAYEIVNEI